MNHQAKELSERLRSFAAEVLAFVEGLNEYDWKKICAPEDWSVGVVARHIGAAHYNAVGLAKMIVNEERLPELTMKNIIDMANQHAREHADCTKEEVLGILRENGPVAVEFIAGLQDSELERTGYLTMVGKELSARQVVEAVILHSGGEHLASMKAAVGK